LWICEIQKSEVKKVASDASIYNRRMLKWMLSKWVRLEDVQKLIEEIKQEYVLVSKEKLEEIYKNLEIDKISGYYVNLEFFRLIEELLQE